MVFTAADTTLGSNGWRAGVEEAAPFLVLGTCSGSGVRATSPASAEPRDECLRRHLLFICPSRSRFPGDIRSRVSDGI